MDGLVKDKNVFVLCFSVTDRHSFKSLISLQERIASLRKDVNTWTALMVGLKIDHERTIPRGEAKSLAARFKMPYLEASAKSGKNVRELFAHIARKAMAKKATELSWPWDPPLYGVALIGTSGCGKSALCLRMTEEEFYDESVHQWEFRIRLRVFPEAKNVVIATASSSDSSRASISAKDDDLDAEDSDGPSSPMTSSQETSKKDAPLLLSHHTSAVAPAAADPGSSKQLAPRTSSPAPSGAVAPLDAPAEHNPFSTFHDDSAHV